MIRTCPTRYRRGESAAAVDKCGQPAPKRDEISDCSSPVMPIGNSRWIPAGVGLPGSAMAGKPSRLIELRDAARRHTGTQLAMWSCR